MSPMQFTCWSCCGRWHVFASHTWKDISVEHGLDELQGVGTSGKSMTRDDCEEIIGKLFYDGLLSLEMGYTAYSTNAYLKLSPHGSRLLQGLSLMTQ